MPSNNKLFEFSPLQIKFILFLSATAFLMSCYLIIRTYAEPSRDPIELPVFFSTPNRQFTGSFLIDPNSSPADSLELLPGIGKTLADRIVAYRQHNEFKQEVDITNVPGIGPKTYERLRPYLRIVR